MRIGANMVDPEHGRGQRQRGDPERNQVVTTSVPHAPPPVQGPFAGTGTALLSASTAFGSFTESMASSVGPFWWVLALVIVIAILLLAFST